MTDDTLSWIRGLPKVELHVHLEGSLTSSTIGELAVRHGRSTAEIWPQGLPERLCFDGFPDFVRQYIFGLSLLRSGEDLYTVVLALAENLAAHRVRYAEVTTTAFLHHHHGMPMSEYADGLNRGRREAARRGVEISWVVDIPREMEPPASMWTVDFLESGAAPDGVVALGLGGHEPGFPAEWFVDSFRRGLALGLGSVPHAGETMGPSSVAAALDSLGAHRLGHGVRCTEDEALLRRIVDDEVMLEVCPTSNILLGVAPSIDDHPIQRLIEVGATFSINTDDPGYFATDLSTELHLIHCHHHLDRPGLREAQRRALAHSYAPDQVRRRVGVEIGEHALHDQSADVSAAEEVPLIDHPAPSAVGLAAGNLRSDAAVGEAGRPQRQITNPEGPLLVPELQPHPGRDEVLEDPPDRLVPLGHLARSERDHGIRLEEPTRPSTSRALTRSTNKRSSSSGSTADTRSLLFMTAILALPSDPGALRHSAKDAPSHPAVQRP